MQYVTVPWLWSQCLPPQSHMYLRAHSVESLAKILPTDEVIDSEPAKMITLKDILCVDTALAVYARPVISWDSYEF